ncbi:MAG: hypothetical protein ABL874_08565, partial [Sphingopyxis sp.]
MLATALAVPPAFAQDVPASSLSIALNLPADQPMLLTISDQRTLPSGTMVTFTIAHHLRFTATGDGWEATVVQQSVDCSGPANACRAYMAMMSSGNQAERHFAISPDGAVTMVTDEQGGALGTAGSVGANASMIVEQAEQSNPGVLRAGELREALQFAGRRIAAAALCGNDSGSLSSDDVIEICDEAPADDAPIAGMHRRTVAHIDRQTGLLVNSVT